MAQEKSLFERLDDISASQEDLLNAISGVDNKVDNTDARIANLERQIQNLKNQTNSTSINNNKPSEPPMKTFARHAYKSWRWFGSRKEFSKAKNLAILMTILMLVFGIASTVVTAISCNGYSPISSVENIWLIFSIIYLVFACVAPIKYEVNAFASKTPVNVEQDDTGMYFPEGGEKIFFRIFRWVTLLGVIGNIGWIWTHTSSISWLATVIEVLFAISIFASFFFNSYLYAQYCICWLEGNNLVTGQEVTIVKVPGAKNFALEKDLREKLPQLFE